VSTFPAHLPGILKTGKPRKAAMNDRAEINRVTKLKQRDDRLDEIDQLLSRWRFRRMAESRHERTRIFSNRLLRKNEKGHFELAPGEESFLDDGPAEIVSLLLESAKLQEEIAELKKRISFESVVKECYTRDIKNAMQIGLELDKHQELKDDPSLLKQGNKFGYGRTKLNWYQAATRTKTKRWFAVKVSRAAKK
jgi:hypothetical protein